MRLAIHSIMWPSKISLHELLHVTKRIGYEGVELFQNPRSLGSAADVYRAVRRYNLTLVGMSGGAFQDRLEFVRQYAQVLGTRLDDPDTPYVYLDEAITPVVRAALDERFKVALHAHMYKPIQTTDEAATILNQNPRLRFLPDSAHLTIAGDDPTAAIDRFRHCIDVAHIKDWRENAGRSYQFYARGFCKLGDGDVDLRAFLIALNKVRFFARRNTWLVVEQDSSPHPEADARASHDWLTTYLPRY